MAGRSFKITLVKIRRASLRKYYFGESPCFFSWLLKLGGDSLRESPPNLGHPAVLQNNSCGNSQGEFCASIILENRRVSFRDYRNSVEIPFGNPRLISGTRPSLGRPDRQVEGVENISL